MEQIITTSSGTISWLQAAHLGEYFLENTTNFNNLQTDYDTCPLHLILRQQLCIAKFQNENIRYYKNKMIL